MTTEQLIMGILMRKIAKQYTSKTFQTKKVYVDVF